jgi:hypothetical protein
MKTKMIYVTPTVKVIKVALEEGIAKVPMSNNIYIDSDWVEVMEPIGSDPATDGGDIMFPF